MSFNLTSEDETNCSPRNGDTNNFFSAVDNRREVKKRERKNALVMCLILLCFSCDDDNRERNFANNDLERSTIYE
jgi:hypothetical protein